MFPSLLFKMCNVPEVSILTLGKFSLIIEFREFDCSIHYIALEIAYYKDNFCYLFSEGIYRTGCGVFIMNIFVKYESGWQLFDSLENRHAYWAFHFTLPSKVYCVVEPEMVFVFPETQDRLFVSLEESIYVPPGSGNTVQCSSR